MLARELDALFCGLAEQGFTMADGLLPPDLIEDLYQEGYQYWQDGQFRPARVGPTYATQRVSTIRGDTIRWLEADNTQSAESRFLAWTETLRQELNEALLLGLRRSEFHFARYEAGAGYARHMDQHRGQPHRRISLILYLTPERHPDDGGELCVFHPEAPEREWMRIAPERGRIVMFRSEYVPHAVLPTRRPRWSVAGWFRNDEIDLRVA